MNQMQKALLLLVMAAASAVAAVAFMPISQDLKAMVANGLTLFCTVGAAILCARAAHGFVAGSAMRAVWGIFALGVLAWGVAQAGYLGMLVLGNGAEPPYPSLADLGFIAAPLLMAWGMWRFRQSLGLEEPLWGALLAIVVFLAAFLTSTVFNWEGLNSTNPLEVVVSLAYAISDPVLLGLAVLTASSFAGVAAARAWWPVTLGALLFVFANQAYSWLQYGEGYVSGGLTDAGWAFGFAFMGLGALVYQSIMARSR